MIKLKSGPIPGRRQVLAAGLIGAAGIRAARAAAPFRIGVTNDMGGVYSAISGRGAVIASQMAAADFGGAVLNRPIEIVGADHQNKPDNGLAIIREWLGPGGVSMVSDYGNTPIALGAQPMLQQANKVGLFTSVGSSVLTGKSCSRYTAHWAHDTYATTGPLIHAMIKRGYKSFYFLVADYTFGDILAGDSAAAVKAGGGKLLGSSRHPLQTSDFASFLLEARTSGAQVIVMCNAGTDSTNAYKQAVEFGMSKQHVFVTPITFLSDIHSLGAAAASGLQFTQSWYWDQTDETRAFAKRFKAATGTIPNDTHAAQYSAVMTYLKAVAKTGTDDGLTVMEAMKAMTISDLFTKNGRVREDGKMIFDRYLTRVKAAQDSKDEWDLLEVLATIPGAEGFRPLAEGGCPFIKV